MKSNRQRIHDAFTNEKFQDLAQATAYKILEHMGREINEENIKNVLSSLAKLEKAGLISLERDGVNLH